MMKCWSAAAALGVAVASGAAGQQMEVSEPVLVMAAPSWGALVEPHLAAHPTEPGWLVGGVMVSDSAPAPSERNHCLSLLSLDGGLTWQRGRMPFGNCADPWLTVTGSGEALFMALGMHPAVGRPGTMGLLMARSHDGGKSWSDTLTSLGQEQDRPTMAADPRASEARSVVVFSGQGIKLSNRPVRWSVFVARSVNAGRSFRLPVNITPSNLNLNSGEGVVLSDGTILASFVDFMRNVDDFRSREGMLERRRIWMLRSADDGRTFSAPLFVSEHCGQSSYDVGADVSEGPHAGRVYLVCRLLHGTAIVLHHSDDQGETWTAPRRISAPLEPGRIATQPRLAVNATGVAAVAWIEVQGDNAAACNRTLVSASTNGGEAFADPVQLAPFSCPDPDRNGFAYRRWRQGGDYFGFTAAADGRFHALWSDARRGPFELRTSSIAVRP